MAEAPDGFLFEGLVESHATGATFKVARGGTTFICKRLAPRVREDKGARERLTSEGAVLHALAGRGAPRLVARGADERGPFIVMERIAMQPLSPQTPLASARFESAVHSTFAALAAVHEAYDARGPLAIVHADVSPDNVLVAEDCAAATLIDFGLSQWRDAKASAETTPRAFRGTALYAAPELARGETIDARADLFALAATLLQSLCGIPPRRAEGAAALLVAAGETPIDDWARDASARIDEGLAARLRRCVAFDKAQRPLRARELL